MKKQSGFTLIELMVVMAIIAILATAGLSAYTGYIKKARDTTRIADLAAINTIILGSIGVNGEPPADGTALATLIRAANNGQMVRDPLDNGSGSKQACWLGSNGGNDIGDATIDGTPTNLCVYWYAKGCSNNASGYMLMATFENKSTALAMYTPSNDMNGGPWLDGSYAYMVGDCSTNASAGTYDVLPSA